MYLLESLIGSTSVILLIIKIEKNIILNGTKNVNKEQGSIPNEIFIETV
jgi:hypothetical protein